MRNINPTFTDKEFKEIEDIKKSRDMTWHAIVFYAIKAYDEDKDEIK